MTKKLWLAIAGSIFAGVVTAGAQEQKAVQEPKPAADRTVPLKLQVVIARYAGEKKLSSMPYTLSVNAPVARQGTANLRMGVEVPINVGGKDASAPQVHYRTIGTNIDCFAQATDDGRFSVSFGIEQSSIDDQQQRGAGPVFRTFKSLYSVQLRDGGSSQHMTATDPVSGEVLKVDVTLNVIK